MLEVRPGTAADHAAAVEVYRQAETLQGQPPTPERVARVAAKLAAELLVVAEDDSVIGFALGEPRRLDDGAGPIVPDALPVSMVFVHPQRQRQGVGSALLEGLADVAWPLGYRTLSAWSSTPGFYQACGLTPTTETRTLPDGGIAVRLSAELEAPTREIALDGTGIRLGQLLKFAGLVDTGAEAKSLLISGGVVVNGEVETRRGRQLRDGDEVRTEGDAVSVRIAAAG